MPAAVDGYTVLLLPCDGTDGSTSFPDSGITGHTVTANGNAQVDTAQKKFGTGSLLCDGGSDYLSIPDSSDWDFGLADFAVDFWLRFNNSSVTQTIVHNQDATAGFSIRWFSGSPTRRFEIQVQGSGFSEINLNFGPSDNVWYHIAFTRYAGTFRFFIDGAQIGSSHTANRNIAGGAAQFRIGADNGGGESLDGWIDEFRVSKGTARWGSNFTPSTQAYPIRKLDFASIL